jgi:hypothetical protein
MLYRQVWRCGLALSSKARSLTTTDGAYPGQRNVRQNGRKR